MPDASRSGAMTVALARRGLDAPAAAPLPAE